jgi:hypothetical protein
MPGLVSDSYDPEFCTSANAADVASALREVVQKVSYGIACDDLRNIVALAQSQDHRGSQRTVVFSERELRIIRFALNRAIESI